MTFVATIRVELPSPDEATARTVAQRFATALFQDERVTGVSCAVVAGTLADPEEAA